MSMISCRQLNLAGTAGGGGDDNKSVDNKNMIQVFLKTMQDNTIILKIDGTGKTDDLKAKVEQRCGLFVAAINYVLTNCSNMFTCVLSGIPPTGQRLICAGKQLEDGRLLSDYKVVEGKTCVVLYLYIHRMFAYVYFMHTYMYVLAY